MSRPRPPKPLDVWCPACGAAPWSKCVPYVAPWSQTPGNEEGRIIDGGKSHERRKAVCRRLRRELGFPPPRVLLDEDGHFRAAKR